MTNVDFVVWTNLQIQIVDNVASQSPKIPNINRGDILASKNATDLPVLFVFFQFSSQFHSEQVDLSDPSCQDRFNLELIQ